MRIWAHYVELITEPAHTLVESTFVFLEFLIFTVLLHRAKRVWHRIIDKEHGVEHPKRPRRYRGRHNLYEAEAIRTFNQEMQDHFREMGPPPGWSDR